MLELTASNYYSLEANKAYCSASQYKDFIGYPLKHGCEARALATLNGTYQPDITKALLIGSILDALWEGATPADLVERFPDCVSTRGATKGEIKAEYRQAIDLYKRSIADKKFSQYMSGEKQVIMTGEIEGLPFKIKMDSYHDGKAIVDLKSTQNASPDFRYYIPDLGQKLPFYLSYGYDIQLAIYQEIVRQNTGYKLPCFLTVVDKKSHPLPQIIQLENKLLDNALTGVKNNVYRIIALKGGEIEPICCNYDECDFCRDMYECKVLSTSEFETHDD